MLIAEQHGGIKRIKELWFTHTHLLGIGRGFGLVGGAGSLTSSV